jgi:hypothetical protein
VAPVRPAAVSGCILALLLLVVPSVGADLTLSVYRTATSTDIYAAGASTLAAPQNTTIAFKLNGYVVSWQPPVGVSGQQVTGYTVYRVPGPATGGAIQTTSVGPRWTLLYDRPGDGTYIYLVTAMFSNDPMAESVPGQPVSTRDGNYPHCNVVGVYFSAPYYDSHLDCLFPLP